MHKRLSLLLIILLLLSTMVEAFHYHDDGDDHADCPICVATHHQAGTGFTAPVYEIPSHSVETPCPRPVLPIVAKSFFSPYANRAPPV